MQNKNFFFLAQYVIFYGNYQFSNALLGRNVREAEEGELNNVVTIVRQSNVPRNIRYDVQCTGTMITHDHILTSEHCFENMGTHSLYVLAESVDLRRARPYYMAWWITYNLWAAFIRRPIEYYPNDIAIIKLIQKVNESILPALISPDENRNLFGLDVVLAGWGKLNDELAPNVMHKVQTRIISNQDCEANAYRIVRRRVTIHPRYLCSISEPWALISAGDSGGPVLFGSSILGVSQGQCPKMNNTFDARKANLHFSVDYYREFIDRNMII